MWIIGIDATGWAGSTRSKDMNKLHHASGNNFHGQWSITLRGPAEGFALSPGQMREGSDYSSMWLLPA